ncbi:TIGR01244 family sulfur transferase [Alteraurantiacibacter buctensis]|uniref:TIGR01244 family phosphatase n=1 Tax=Alteraurantiacibacter buctensis TaxID=1503981 RepID=A0A844YTP2_9SPHN|nr:TIGR01244 family sulfur transferase [Alteraurantiacibacter buctensis]MXO70919.1 TIGR01244 family phosphatase [Alteraurantiacibacter buctensis]
MSDFRQLSDQVWASPQITLADVQAAAAMGFALVINNRPEGESPDQTPGEDIAAAVRAAGMDYCAIPIAPGGFTHEQVADMAKALGEAGGPVLAYCRSGTRSTLLWSLAQAAAGEDPDSIASAALQAGYDIAPIRGIVESLAAEARN